MTSSALHRPGLLVTVLLALGIAASAADRPSAEQWAPVEKAIASDDAEAEDKIAAITGVFPAWSDGFRALAQVQLHRKETAAAAASARQALALAPGDASAAALAVEALGSLGQSQDAYAIADRFTGVKDPQGWVNFYAAVAATNAKDRTKAEHHLGLALARNPGVPAEFSYLDARIALLADDLERAAASLIRATSANPRFWDGWHELGVVQARLAERKAADAITYLKQSEASFTKVASAIDQDYESWQGLGSTQLRLAQVLLPDSESDGKAKAREAITSLRKAIELKEDQRDAQLALGQALLLTEAYAEAIPHLLRARELGAGERALGFNLLLAYQKTGRTAEFAAEAKNLTAVSPGEKITTGMGLYHAGSYELAIQLLTSAAADLDSTADRERLGMVQRFIGHAHHELAESGRQRLAAAPSADQPALRTAIEAHLDAARESYRSAGSLHDFPAQHHFMAQETARSPELGYAAGWQQLEWHSYLSPAGWFAVIGNYGGAATGGGGIAGLWERHPVHLVVWALLAFLPLCLFIASFFRRAPPVDATSGERPARPAPATAIPVPTRPPATRTPSPAAAPARASSPPAAPARASSPPAAPARSAPTAPPPKHRTPAPAAPKAPSALERKSKSETEPAIVNPLLPTRIKSERPEAGDNSALERRINTPKPGAGAPPRRPPPPRS